MNIKLYSTNCPKCIVLEKKLEQKNISFEKISDFDVAFLIEKGFKSAPILEVDEKFMNFKDANEWVNNFE